MTGSQVTRQRLRKPLCYCLGTMASRVEKTDDELIEELSENVNIKKQKTLVERFCELQFYLKRFYSLWPEAKVNSGMAFSSFICFLVKN